MNSRGCDLRRGCQEDYREVLTVCDCDITLSWSCAPELDICVVANALGISESRLSTRANFEVDLQQLHRF